jgi:hypothetical protein
MKLNLPYQIILVALSLSVSVVMIIAITQHLVAGPPMHKIEKERSGGPRSQPREDTPKRSVADLRKELIGITVQQYASDRELRVRVDDTLRELQEAVVASTRK